jgi:hypothetical protein
MEGERHRRQVLHRHARELLYKAFSYFTREADAEKPTATPPIYICLHATRLRSCRSPCRYRYQHHNYGISYNVNRVTREDVKWNQVILEWDRTK